MTLVRYRTIYMLSICMSVNELRKVVESVTSLVPFFDLASAQSCSSFPRFPHFTPLREYICGDLVPLLETFFQKRELGRR